MIPEQTAQSAAPPDMERIVGAYGNAVLRMCFLYLKDSHLAEDASQETFLKVYRNYAFRRHRRRKNMGNAYRYQCV